MTHMGCGKELEDATHDIWGFVGYSPRQTRYLQGHICMKKTSKRFRIVCGVLFGLALLVWAAYAYYASRYPHWKERVQLSDGRTVTVTQRRDFQPGYGTHQTWLRFELPESQGLVTWNEKLYPVMLGADAGKVYVVGRTRGYQQIQTHLNPRYMYIAFELKKGKFIRIPFLSVPKKLRLIENVRWCFPGGADERVLEWRGRPSWCDDMDPKWPTPQVVDLEIREAEAISWASISNTKKFSE